MDMISHVWYWWERRKHRLKPHDFRRKARIEGMMVNLRAAYRLLEEMQREDQGADG